MAGYNRNRKKKTYSYTRQQVSRVVVSQPGTEHSEWFDQTRTTEAGYPAHELTHPTVQGDTPHYAQYDEGVINFNFTDSKTQEFTFEFSNTPVVTLEVLADTTTGEDNVNVFLTNVTTTEFTVQTSAPLVGQVVYRAIHSNVYPTVVMRNVASSSYAYTASAGYVDWFGADSGELDYLALGPGLFPTNLFVTPRDIRNNHEANVALVGLGTYGSVSTAVSFSAPVSNRINFLAVK